MYHWYNIYFIITPTSPSSSMESMGRAPRPVDPAVVGAVVVQSVETVTGPNSLTVPGQDGGSVPG